MERKKAEEEMYVYYICYTNNSSSTDVCSSKCK